jgi:hypothetical protein
MRDIAVFSTLKLALASITQCRNIANKLLDDGGRKVRTLASNAVAAIGMHALPA